MVMKLALNLIASISTKEGHLLQEGQHWDWEPYCFILLLDPGSNIVKGIVVLKRKMKTDSCDNKRALCFWPCLK